MTVRTDDLAHGRSNLAASTYVEIATVPADERWILKECLLVEEGGGASNVYLTLKRAGVRTDILLRAFTANGQLDRQSMWTVLDAGDVLEIVASTAGYRHFHLSGARLVI